VGPCNRLRDTTSSSLTSATRNERDADRLGLLDRIADRVPELHLDQQSLEWTTLDDGHEALLVNGGGFDGGQGAFSPTPATTCAFSLELCPTRCYGHLMPGSEEEAAGLLDSYLTAQQERADERARAG
jgi:hypothetical protein